MYIDFHTHAFVDDIAKRAIDKLVDTIMTSGYPDPVPALTDGTAKNLLERMDEWGIDAAVLLPIATKPSQQATINNWAASLISDKLYCYGTVHPDSDDWETELVRIKSLGLKGIKLHPDYQNFLADEKRIFPLYKKCAEIGLPILFHAGLDALSMDLIHCTPKMGAEIIKEIPELTLIMAHLGGNKCWDDVEKYLVGKNVYFDTAFLAGCISEEQAARIINNHGADKILLASDCPWHSTADEIEFINRLSLTDEQKNKIFYQNALKLLNT